MFRAVILVALLFAAAVPSRTVAAAVAAEPAAPAAIAPVTVAPARVAPAPVAHPGPEIGLGALQLVAGYGVEIGGIAGLAAVGIFPKNLGWHSDYANLGFIAALAPALGASPSAAPAP